MFRCYAEYCSKLRRRYFGRLIATISLLASAALIPNRLLATSSSCALTEVERDFGAQRYSAAAAGIESYVRTCPQSSRIYQKLGFAYYFTGAPEKALEALRTAKIWRASELHVQIGEAAHAIGDHSKELDEAREALTLTPGGLNVMLLSARACKETGDFSCCEQIFLKCIRLHPSEHRAYQGLASLYIELGDYRKAEASLRKASTLDPNQPDLLRELGRVYKLLGKNQEARAAYAQANRYKAAPAP